MVRITQKELAKKLHVSQTTISRVVRNSVKLKKETKARIAAHIQKSGYVPNLLAKGLREGRTNTVGLILPYFNFLEGYNTARIVAGLGATANSLNYHLIVTDFSQYLTATQALQEIIHGRRMDGVFAFLDIPTVDPPFLSFLQQEEIPFIFLNSNRPERDLCCVGSENLNGVCRVTGHLVQQGRRRFAFLGENPHSLLASERLEGYRKALRDSGISFSLEIARNAGYRNYPEFGYQETFNLLRGQERPDAIVCYADEMAIGALRAAGEKGLKIPDEISIVGFGDVKESGHTIPPLTTVREDGYQIGKTAMEMMAAILKGESLKERKVKIPTELVVRGS